ncbi:MAG: hypothetical protein ACYCY8_06940 [Burkholderiales bacterium]
MNSPAYRSPLILDLFQKWRNIEAQETHPIFTVVEGDVEPWERP